VTLLDANQAVLGSFTSLGDASTAGAIYAANGVLIDFGNNLVGFGLLDTPNAASLPTIINGSVIGDSAAHPLTLTGFIKGVGTLDNVILTGTYSPGFSPAAVTLGSVAYSSTSHTVVELGGTTPGSEHDQLNHTGQALLDGTLKIELINGFIPQVGDSFIILTAENGIVGAFSGVELPAAPSGTGWHVAYEANEVRVELRALTQVSDVQFGDGAAQRSRIDQIVVTFQGAVEIDAGAFSVVKRGADGGSVDVSFTTTLNENGDTVATLSFSGMFTRYGGALLDGYYQLTIDSSKVRVSGTSLTLDGDHDGEAGGDWIRGDAESDNFFAFYGDSNGDGLVGVAEYGEFRATFGKLPTDDGYDSLFDYDGLGVGVNDFSEFQSRFGKSKLPWE
jgi:hypothetical protein